MKKFIRTLAFTAIGALLINAASAQAPHIVVDESTTTTNPIYVKLAGLGQNLTGVSIYLTLHIEGDVTCQTPSLVDIKHFEGPINTTIKTATQKQIKSGTASFYFNVPTDLDQQEFRGYQEGVCPPGEAIITNVSNLTYSNITAYVNACTKKNGCTDFVFPL